MTTGHLKNKRGNKHFSLKEEIIKGSLLIASQLPFGPRAGIQHQDSVRTLGTGGHSGRIDAVQAAGMRALVATTAFLHLSAKKK